MSRRPDHEGATDAPRERQFRALVRAGLALTREHALEEVLRAFVDAAREVLGARYAALGVLDATGTFLSQFIFSGLSDEEAERIGEPPHGRGLLGVVIREGLPVRLSDISRDPRSYGFPPNHPRMKSFLGVPVRVRGRVFGNLYATEKVGADEFSAEDQEMAELLAAQAAVAIENARLYHERNVFTAIINHEIRNAVAGVLGWSERLRRLSQALDAEVVEAAGFTRDAAAQLHRLVSDLLELSRIESGRAELQVSEADLRALIREVVAACQPSAEARQVALHTEGMEDSATIATDPQRARQILLNLVSNAIKFTRPRSTVTVRARSVAGSWAIDVADEGPGVPEAKREKIFEAYGQADESHRRMGTGLGLTVSRALARILGGDITVADAPGGGALFTLHLPRHRYGVSGDGP